ncbi:MAG: hypothetical protein M1837_000890 [Sclerophora amabilis]|nr:MAG: hypothetical protein M1837_000890 [Sclerophora amabilis]
MAVKRSRISVPTTSALSHKQKVPSNSRIVVKTLSKLSRHSLLALVLQWLEDRNLPWCQPYLAAPDDDDDGADGLYPAATSLESLKMTYEILESQKGGKREVLDRILEGDWRNGITQYQLAMADMTYGASDLADHPKSQNWTALDLVQTGFERGQLKKGTAKAFKGAHDTGLPQLHAQTFLRNLHREIAPIVKAHFYVTRSKYLPITLLRISICDTPYSNQHTSSKSLISGEAATSIASTIFVAFPDGTPTLYFSSASIPGQAMQGNMRDAKNIVLESLPKAFSKPQKRYRLEASCLSARSLPALLSLRGPGRSNAANGGWITYAEGAVEAGPLEFATSEISSVDKGSRGSGPVQDEDCRGEENPEVREDEGRQKRRRMTAQGRFGTSAMESDEKGIDRLDIRMKDPYPDHNEDPPRRQEGTPSEDSRHDGVTDFGQPFQQNPSVSEDAVSDTGNDGMGSSKHYWVPELRLAFQGTHVFAGIRTMAEIGLVDCGKMPGWMTGEDGISMGSVRKGRIPGVHAFGT